MPCTVSAWHTPDFWGIPPDYTLRKRILLPHSRASLPINSVGSAFIGPPWFCFKKQIWRNKSSWACLLALLIRLFPSTSNLFKSFYLPKAENFYRVKLFISTSAFFPYIWNNLAQLLWPWNTALLPYQEISRSRKVKNTEFPFLCKSIFTWRRLCWFQKQTDSLPSKKNDR